MPTSTTCGIFLYSTLLKKILACHATNSPWNRWSIPKGLKDDGETIFEAASRELMEETGLDIKELNVLAIHSLPAVKYKKQNKILESFLVITGSEIASYPFKCSTLIDDRFPEVDSWKWISLELAPKYLHESQLQHLERISSLLPA
ncbi:MAG: NUDIX hydrolase [Bacteroidia bacterium]